MREAGSRSRRRRTSRIAAVNTPGAASGTMTLRNACHGVAPSTWAACSSSQGISPEEGRQRPDRQRQREGQVGDDQARPGVVEAERRATCRTAGRRARSPGTSRSPARSTSTQLLAAGSRAGRSRRPRTIASTTEITVAISAMPIELSSAAGEQLVARRRSRSSPRSTPSGKNDVSPSWHVCGLLNDSDDDPEHREQRTTAGSATPPEGPPVAGAVPAGHQPSPLAWARSDAEPLDEHERDQQTTERKSSTDTAEPSAEVHRVDRSAGRPGSTPISVSLRPAGHDEDVVEDRGRRRACGTAARP